MSLDTVFNWIFTCFEQVIVTLDQRLVFTWGGFRISMLDALATALFLFLLFRVFTPGGDEE